MLKAEVKQGDKIRLVVAGNLPEITTDVVMLVRSVIESLREKSEDAAKAAAMTIIAAMDSGDLFDCTAEEVEAMRGDTREILDLASILKQLGDKDGESDEAE